MKPNREKPSRKSCLSTHTREVVRMVLTTTFLALFADALWQLKLEDIITLQFHLKVRLIARNSTGRNALPCFLVNRVKGKQRWPMQSPNNGRTKKVKSE